MKPIILAAFSKEIEPIVKYFHLKKSQPYGHTHIWRGGEFELIRTGIGKVNAAATTQLVIEREKPMYLINVGIAGGFAAETTLGNIVIPTDVIQYDIDQTSFGFKLGQLPESTTISLPLAQPDKTIPGTIKGRCLTGDRIVSDKSLARQLEQTFHPTIAEMELGAIAQVCQYYNVKLFAVKAVVDIVEKEEIIASEKRIFSCMSRLFPILEEMLKAIP